MRTELDRANALAEHEARIDSGPHRIASTCDASLVVIDRDEQPPARGDEPRRDGSGHARHHVPPVRADDGARRERKQRGERVRQVHRAWIASDARPLPGAYSTRSSIYSKLLFEESATSVTQIRP